MHVNLLSYPDGDRVTTHVFIGSVPDATRNAGTLVLRPDEWRLFVASLCRGAQGTGRRLTVTSENQEAVVRHFEKKEVGDRR